MATDHNFRIKNGLTVQGSTLVVNNTENISGTQVYIKKLDSSTNLQRWGEGTNGGQQSTFRFRIDQNFKFIGNSGSGDTITIFSSSGDVNTAGNITITDNSSYLATRQILARDTNGLTLKTSGGTEALAIHNNGRVGIAASTSTSSSNALKLHVGTINNTGSSAIAQFGGFIRASEYYILHETTGSTNSIFIDYNGNDLDVRAGEGSYTGVIRTNGYKVGTTTVIDSSRNLLNIGTIGSGAITSTGAVNATYFSDGYIQWTAAQLNRYGAAIELQFSPTNSSTLVKIGANGSNPTIFNAYTGAATFNGAVTSSGAITGSSLSSTSGDISLNGETFVREKLYSGVSNIGASGSYYTLFNITESNTPTYITLKTAAHSTQTFVVTTGYWGSNVAHVQMLSSTYTQNGAYPGVSAVRILKDSSNNYKFQLKLTYSSGPTGFYIYARAFGATGAADVPTFESSLTVDSSTGSTIDELDTGFTGTSSSRQHRAGVGSNSTPSYSFTGDSNTGMYRDTSDSIGFASNGAQRVTISNSGLDIKSGTLRISGTDVISSSRNLTNIGTATFNGGVTMNSTLNCASTIGIAGTTVIDGSRNLTNIGTISSGAITSSGTLNTQANSAAAGVNIKRTNAGSGGSKGFI